MGDELCQGLNNWLDQTCKCSSEKQCHWIKKERVAGEMFFKICNNKAMSGCTIFNYLQLCFKI